MRKYLFALLGASALLVVSTPSFADNEFYVELGSDTNQNDAPKEWDALVQKHKNLLGHLKFFPKAVIQSGNTISTRIQAGPITSKEKAQKICGKLFKDNIPCFVIEGLGDTPPTSVMNLSEQSEEHPVKVIRLPWLTGSDVSPAPIQELPAAASDEGNHNGSGQQKGDRQAEVRVAEAIRVPLTEGEDQQKNTRVVVKSLPNLRPTFSKDGKYADESSDSGAGWLTVEAFPDEEIATSFWEEVRAAVPKQANKLHVHILKPLVTHDQPKASLNLGPFASSSDAYNFCREGIQARDRGLICSFSNNEPGNQQLASSDRGDAYNAARMGTRHRPVENPPAYLAPAAAPVKQYWIQVASAGSQIEALHLWEDIKAKNDDLMQGLRSSISVSTRDKNTYVVRVGPILNNDDAIKSCTKMQERSINCRVILYSTVAR